MNKIALPVIALSVLIGASPFIANELLLEKQTHLKQNMKAVTVADKVTKNGTRVGVNPGKNLNFGEIETGIRVTKFLDYDSGNQTRLVRLNVKGNISGKINVTQEQLIRGDTRISIAFRSNEPGYYTGQATLKTLTPRGELGEKWLKLRQSFFW